MEKIPKLQNKNTKATDKLVNRARWASQCFVFNTYTITDPFYFIKVTFRHNFLIRENAWV